MQIDPNAQTRSSTSTQPPLSPELAKLVADLKLSIGQSLEALVTRVQVVTEVERQELLSQQPAPPKNPAERQLRSLLQEPALKLVELKIQQNLVPTLTALPLAKAQAIQVLLTSRGLLLVPPAQQQATTAALQTVAQTAASIPVATTPAPAVDKPVTPAPPARAATSTVQTAPPSVTKGNSGSSGTVARTNLSNPLLTQSTATPEPTGRAPGPVPGSPTLISQARPLIAETLARTLPQGRELPPLLGALAELNQQLRTIPRATLPPEIRQLHTLLNKLPALSLNLAQLNPARPESLRQALEQSGVFYERRMLGDIPTGTDQGPRKLPEHDLKGLLIQVQQWLNTPPPPVPLSNRAPMPDALGQILLGLVQIFLPRQKPQRDMNALQQLKSAVQQQVEQSLARIQTQQMRTLNSRLLDPDAPQQAHLDIPLRLPEGYGNLYLHLFEPRLPSEPDKEPGKKQQRRQNKGRWRVFMELMLDEFGGLAAEISVLEQDLEITLWTEREALRERANAHLRELRRDLEQQGLVVRDLQCSQHPPPAQKVQLDYALIDVKT